MRHSTRTPCRPIRYARLIVGLGLVYLSASVLAAGGSNAAHPDLTSAPASAANVDPITGLPYGPGSESPFVSGIAVTVDADGHIRAVCVEPSSTDVESTLHRVIEPATHRLRFE